MRTTGYWAMTALSTRSTFEPGSRAVSNIVIVICQLRPKVNPILRYSRLPTLRTQYQAAYSRACAAATPYVIVAVRPTYRALLIGSLNRAHAR